MIHFYNVKKSFRVRNTRKFILHGLSVTFPERNIGILGANGAGKSTLLRLIAGTERPDSGTIKREANISWPLGFAGSFNGTLTGAENVKFVARIYGQDTEYLLDFVADFSELGDFFYMPVRSYSSGMRARLAFGVSMAIDFEYYLIDEITAVGDKRFRDRCQEVFTQKLSHSKIIIVSHSMPTLRNYCDMGAVINDGELLFYDDLEEAIAVHETNMAG